MWDLIESVPDHCLYFYFVRYQVFFFSTYISTILFKE